MKNCPNCDYVEKDDSAIFCQNCGKNFVTVTESASNQVSDQKTIRFVSERQMKTQKVRRPKSLITGILIGVLFFGFIFGGVFTMFFGNFNFNQYVGDLNYTGSTDSYTSIEISFDTALGNIEISSANNLNGSFAIEQKVYSNQANQDINSVDHVEIDYSIDNIVVSFKTKSNSFSFFGSTSFKHDFVIRVDSNLLIKDLLLISSTGSIKANLADQSLSAVHLETSTGDIESSFSNCTFSGGPTLIQASTGSISFELFDSLFLKTQQWDIKSSTGSVTSSIDVRRSMSNLQSFHIESSTGSVDLTRNYQVSVSESLTAHVSTGKIMFDGVDKGKNFKIQQGLENGFSYNLQTSTGDITIS
jgi:hypothetical protein